MNLPKAFAENLEHLHEDCLVAAEKRLKLLNGHLDDLCICHDIGRFHSWFTGKGTFYPKEFSHVNQFAQLVAGLQIGLSQNYRAGLKDVNALIPVALKENDGAFSISQNFWHKKLLLALTKFFFKSSKNRWTFESGCLLNKVIISYFFNLCYYFL